MFGLNQRPDGEDQGLVEEVATITIFIILIIIFYDRHLHNSHHHHFHDRHLHLRILVILIILTTVVFITVLEYYRDPRKHLLVTVDMTTSRIFNLTIPVSACIIIIIIIDITSYRDEQQHLYVYLTRIRFFISIVYSTFLFIFLFS